MHACALGYIGRDSNRDEPSSRAVAIIGFSKSV
jgi:hypothetical protein